MIPQDFLQQLLSRVDIVDVIDKHVKLKKSGQNYSACCPFHNEKTPSFSVSPIKQFYHCFGCGVSGTAISFLMEYNGMAFRDAVTELAESVGMALPVEANREEAIERARESATLGEVLSAAMQFYRAQLKKTPKAIDYLKGRGLTGEIAAKFALGYSPDDWQGLKGAVEDYTATALVESGLVIENDEGKRYDRFRDRVMFPILDARGGVIGFGGRVIGAGEPKYLNSPETPLFEKGRELYGLFQARRAIRDTQTVVVVEGYMDVVALAQSGVENAVATLGTATTPMHVQKLLRVADNLVFCFDGDKAGRRAAWRALEQSLPVVSDGKDTRFLFLPPEDDPDTFVRRLGKDAFLTEIRNAKPLSQFLFDELQARVAEESSMASDEGRARLLSYAKPMLATVTAPALGLMLRRKLAELTGLGAIEIERIVPMSAVSGPPLQNTQRPGTSKASSPPSEPEGRGTKPPWKGKNQPALGAPPPRIRQALSLGVKMIAHMLNKPALAGKFDVALPDDDPSAEAVAYRVACYIRDHDFEVMAANIHQHFAGGADGALVTQAMTQPMIGESEMLKMDVDAEFDEALAKLRAEAEVKRKRTETLRRAQALGLN